VLINKAKEELAEKVNEILSQHKEELENYIQELALKYEIPMLELKKHLAKGK
jgi:hypothetical protein